jgi:hypothetical protein
LFFYVYNRRKAVKWLERLERKAASCIIRSAQVELTPVEIEQRGSKRMGRILYVENTKDVEYYFL